mgnify:CR=1 FL=1
MAKYRWSKEVEWSIDCLTNATSSLCPDFEEDGFKERINKNQEGVDEATLEQAFFFRRLDIFNEIIPNEGTKPLLPYPRMDQPMLVSEFWYGYRMSSRGVSVGQICDVLDFYNYNDTKKIGNIDIFEKITNEFGNDGGLSSVAVDRKRMYCRSGWPYSSKDNWKRMSNNFRISKITKKKTSQASKRHKLKTTVFPKSVSERFDDGRSPQKSIIAFTGIDIEFEGTYQETARSDVMVKIRFTMDSFDLLENYYTSTGDILLDVNDYTANPDNWVRFLDLFTPQDIDEDNLGIMLEAYTNFPDNEDCHHVYSHGNESLAYGNYLKLHLHIVDHTMTFNEITNKVDVSIEYRAAVDMDKSSNPWGPENILYDEVGRKKLSKIMKNANFLVEEGCDEEASKEIDKIADIPKKEFRDHLTLNSAYRKTRGGPLVWFDDPDLTKRGYIKNYNLTDYGTWTPETKTDLHGTDYTTDSDDFHIAYHLFEANVSSTMRSYHFIGLRNLLNEFIAPVNMDYYKVLLPFIPHKIRGLGNNSNGFYLGDLPIVVEHFEEWFNNKYINENRIHLDAKEVIKDIILNYVNPALKLAFWDEKETTRLTVSSVNTFGDFDHNTKGKLKSPRVTKDHFGFADHTQSVFFNKVIPDSTLSTSSINDFEDDHGNEYVIINVQLDAGPDALAGRIASLSTTREKIDEISSHHLVIEGKSPYGPWATLKIDKNNSDYIREMRLEKQGKTDISQLGAVYDVTVKTYANCPDFRFFPGAKTFLYIPDFGLSMEKDNLAYKLGLGGTQIVTKVKHNINLEDTAKMTTEVTMRFWNHGAKNAHIPPPASTSHCAESYNYDPVSVEKDDFDDWVDPTDAGWSRPRK